MARPGIYKSEVLRARDKLRATGRNPSIDAVREELGHTGSKSTIHRYLKELEEEEGGASGKRVAVSETIQDLVERLAARLNEEGEELVAVAHAKHALQIKQHQQEAAALKTEAQSTREQLEKSQRALADKSAAHEKTSEALRANTLMGTQLSQQVLDLQERIAAEERHRQSLEEKHLHARQALEHFRQSSKEQRDQDQRKHEQQVQYLQAELRAVNETFAAKQQEAILMLQENARLLGDLSRAQGDLHQIQEEVRSLRPLKDELGFAQRRTEELGRRLVQHEAAVNQVNASNEQLQTKVGDLLAEKQQLELALATARSSVATQEQFLVNVLDRLGTATLGPTLSVQTQNEEAKLAVQSNDKNPAATSG